MTSRLVGYLGTRCKSPHSRRQGRALSPSALRLICSLWGSGGGGTRGKGGATGEHGRESDRLLSLRRLAGTGCVREVLGAA